MRHHAGEFRVGKLRRAGIAVCALLAADPSFGRSLHHAQRPDAVHAAKPDREYFNFSGAPALLRTMRAQLIPPSAKVSTLIGATTLTGPELFYVVQGGVSKNITYSALKSQVPNYPSYVCRNNVTLDDGPGLTSALSSASGTNQMVILLGGVCYIKTSITAPSGGFTGLACSTPGFQTIPFLATNCVIRAAANLTTMLSQVSLTSPIYDFNITGVAFDGNKGSYTVGTIIHLSTQQSYFTYDQISNGSGDCFNMEASASTTWLNYWGTDTIGSCGGAGLIDSGSDDFIVGNEIGGNFNGVEFPGSGPHNFVGNRIEVNSNNGVLVTTPSNACGNNNTIFNSSGNLIEQNGAGYVYEQGTCSGGTPAVPIMSGVQTDTFIANTQYDFFVNGPNMNYLAMGPNSHLGSPVDAYYGFGAGGTKTNMSIRAQISDSGTAITTNAPAGLTVHTCGATNTSC